MSTQLPSSWSRMRLSAPVWAWLLYAAAVVLLMGVAANGRGLGVLAAGLAAFASFEFWTWAAYRGFTRDPGRDAATNPSDEEQ